MTLNELQKKYRSAKKIDDPYDYFNYCIQAHLDYSKKILNNLDVLKDIVNKNHYNFTFYINRTVRLKKLQEIYLNIAKYIELD